MLITSAVAWKHADSAFLDQFLSNFERTQLNAEREERGEQKDEKESRPLAQRVEQIPHLAPRSQQKQKVGRRPHFATEVGHCLSTNQRENAIR